MLWTTAANRCPYRSLTPISFAIGCCLWYCCQTLDHLRPDNRPTHSRRFERIISISPAVTEWICALGCGDRLVAVGRHCHVPEEIRSRSKVGDAFNPNFELITRLNPDGIVIQGQSATLANYCRRRQIPLIRVELDDLASIHQTIFVLGQSLDRVAAARELSAGICRELADVQHRVAPFQSLRTFVCISRSSGALQPLYTMNSSGFLSELLALAGGANVFGDLKQEYFAVSGESVLVAAPDVILELRPGMALAAGDQENLQSDWQALGMMPAVAQNRIHALTQDYLLVPGPRVVQTAQLLAQILHPIDIPSQ